MGLQFAHISKKKIVHLFQYQAITEIHVNQNENKNPSNERLTEFLQNVPLDLQQRLAKVYQGDFEMFGYEFPGT